MTVLNSPNGMMKAYKYYKQTLQLLPYQSTNNTSSSSNVNKLYSYYLIKVRMILLVVQMLRVHTIILLIVVILTANSSSTTSRNTNTNKYKQWVLKCRLHMMCIDEIKSIYPDSKLIWCHRHPCSTVPSLCSFLKGCHQTYFEDSCFDDFTLGQVVKKTTENWLKFAPKSGLLCQHVMYNKLTENPIEVIR